MNWVLVERNLQFHYKLCRDLAARCQGRGWYREYCLVQKPSTINIWERETSMAFSGRFLISYAPNSWSDKDESKKTVISLCDYRVRVGYVRQTVTSNVFDVFRLNFIFAAKWLWTAWGLSETDRRNAALRLHTSSDKDWAEPRGDGCHFPWACPVRICTFLCCQNLLPCGKVWIKNNSFKEWRPDSPFPDRQWAGALGAAFALS